MEVCNAAATTVAGAKASPQRLPLCRPDEAQGTNGRGLLRSGPSMIIEVQFTADCPNAAPILNLLSAAASERPELTVTAIPVGYDEPPPNGFAGSPTVLVDGVNPFRGDLAESAACAMHPPSIEQVNALLDEISIQSL